MKCQCAECGATKFRFIKGQSGQGILGTFTESLMKSGTDQLQKVYNTAPQYQLHRATLCNGTNIIEFMLGPKISLSVDNSQGAALR